MPTAQEIGLMFQTIGAGLDNRMPEFQAEQKQKGEDDRAATLERQKTVFSDSQSALELVKQGRFDLAAQLGQMRLQDSQHFPGVDFSDTQALTEMSMRAAGGDVQAQEQLTAQLTDNVMKGRALGVLEGPAAKEYAQGTGDMAGYSFDSTTGEYKKSKALESGGKGRNQKQINELRKTINGYNKDFAKVEAAWSRIKKTGMKATPASDISLIFNYMKMNDPGSTVREGEFATAQNAGGADTKLINVYNQLIKGTRLSSAQRKDFTSQSLGLFEAQRESLDSQIGNVLGEAEVDGITGPSVLGKGRFKRWQERQDANQQPAQPAAPPQMAAPQDLSQLSDEQLQQMLAGAQ